MSGEVTGTWFPSGFYGHYLSKKRNDFIQEYRLEARPFPPERLVQRSKENPRKHVFSKHDNRQLFLSDATYFENGLGRFKVKSAISQAARFKPDFITWAPQKDEIARSGPGLSTYQTSFTQNQPPQAPNKLIVPRITMPELPAMYVTSYNHTYRHSQPNPSVNTDILTGKVVTWPLAKEATFAYTQPHRCLNKKQTSSVPLTVSDCLLWQTG
ncbi:uncharacterized protein C3orf84-like isoform X1 [Acipenser ruthenus]|uniref:uncharacterized protein C3orf84-like isoform X1 n=1 Tax=Acipenser ruthenus TaxID=7906 RepID=UPI00274235CF|nr:uncharacterized protein C3orf84-like isoform X1 [Acipenser ruthenus]